MENIILPSRVDIVSDKKNPNKATITIEPCFYGYGKTLGNALRRVMLSSMPGGAVTAIKLKGATHEFSTLPNVKEDILEIMLNFKELRLKVFSNEPVKLTLRVKGEKEVTAADISKSSDVEIINPDLHLITLTGADADLEIEIIVSQGRGYVTSEMRENEDLELGMISVDSIFTPIKNIGYKTENVRVGQITNYDKLIFDIETDGIVSPKDVFIQSVQILIDHFNILMQGVEGKLKEEKLVEEEAVASGEAEEKEKGVEIEVDVPKKKRGRPKKSETEEQTEE